MKKQNIFSMVLCALMATATLTSCEGALDDIFGEWSRPVKPLSIEETPLTIEAVESGTIQVLYKKGLTLPKPITYTKNGVSTSITASTDITVAAGDIISFSSENSTLNSDLPGCYLNILADHKIYVYGNAMSLINDEGDFSKDKTISGEYALCALFYGNTELYNHPEKKIILPATTLSKGCYAQLFYGCNKMATAPELPAMEMKEECYYEMFSYCRSFTTAPTLPATSLSTQCYYRMFYECTSLTTAPELPATTLAEYCYYGMFNNCTSLTTAPALPATELTEDCYDQMFYGCTILTAAPALPATTLKKKCYHGMFVGCYALTETPHLPAVTLVDKCYKYMFLNCSALTKAYVKAGYDATNCEDMFAGCDEVTTSTFYTDGTGWDTADGVTTWNKLAYE